MGTAPVPKTEPAQIEEVASPADVPAFDSDEAAARYWETHAPGPSFFEAPGAVVIDTLPPARPRTTPVSIRFDADTLTRLKSLARRRHKGYQTLLKEFVIERLYEEEKRAGVVGR